MCDAACCEFANALVQMPPLDVIFPLRRVHQRREATTHARIRAPAVSCCRAEQRRATACAQSRPVDGNRPPVPARWRAHRLPQLSQIHDPGMMEVAMPTVANSEIIEAKQCLVGRIFARTCRLVWGARSVWQLATAGPINPRRTPERTLPSCRSGCSIGLDVPVCNRQVFIRDIRLSLAFAIARLGKSSGTQLRRARWQMFGSRYRAH